jgi:hypothetical protein
MKAMSACITFMRRRGIGVGLLLPFFASAGAAQKFIDVGCRLFAFLQTVAFVVGVVYAIVAAFKYMSSGGEATKVSEAHKTLTYAAVGIGVAIIAEGFPSLVADLLGSGAPGGC